MSLRIIAEAGENHLGDVDRAMRMVGLAAKAGADFIKFQSYSVDDLADGIAEDARRWIRRTQLSREAHEALRKEANRQGILFLSTAVNVRWASFLAEIGCDAIKLASLSLTNRALLEFAGRYFKEVFLSTGMGDLAEIRHALEAIGNRPRVTVLHCVSEYPVPDERASLLSIPFLREKLSCPVGYSDHTIGASACLAAVALGAELIEKHFTLDKTLEGSDHILSADPDELAYIVEHGRKIVSMLGESDKRPNPREIENRKVMRTLFIET